MVPNKIIVFNTFPPIDRDKRRNCSKRAISPFATMFSNFSEDFPYFFSRNVHCRLLQICCIWERVFLVQVFYSTSFLQPLYIWGNCSRQVMMSRFSVLPQCVQLYSPNILDDIEFFHTFAYILYSKSSAAICVVSLKMLLEKKKSLKWTLIILNSILDYPCTADLLSNCLDILIPFLHTTIHPQQTT